jgi:secretion/DNA translocation related TadE-like protein
MAVTRLRGDTGAGTVWVIAFMSLVWLVGIVAVTVGSVRVARHRVDAAADLAALGAAARRAEGEVAACRAAAEVVARSRARLTRCSLQGGIAEVSVVAGIRVLLGVGEKKVASWARAGPAVPEPVS